MANIYHFSAFLCVLCVFVVNLLWAAIMDLSSFLHDRRPSWKRLEELLERAEGSGLACLNEDEAVEFGNLYRRTASDLNQAQTFVSGDVTVRYLNDLVARAYLLIYGKSRIDWRGMAMFLVFGWPAVFRRYLPHFLIAVGLFAFGVVFGFLASYYDKDVRPAIPPADGHADHPAARGGPEATPRRKCPPAISAPSPWPFLRTTPPSRCSPSRSASRWGSGPSGSCSRTA